MYVLQHCSHVIKSIGVTGSFTWRSMAGRYKKFVLPVEGGSVVVGRIKEVLVSCYAVHGCVLSKWACLDARS